MAKSTSTKAVIQHQTDDGGHFVKAVVLSPGVNQDQKSVQWNRKDLLSDARPEIRDRVVQPVQPAPPASPSTKIKAEKNGIAARISPAPIELSLPTRSRVKLACG